MSLPWVIAAAVVLLAGGLLWIYNGLVRRRNRVDATWSDIDVFLRRRHDLVPNLVAAVQGYAGHESQTMRAVAEARASAVSAQGPRRIGEAESSLAGGVRSLFADAEAYPQLKASTPGSSTTMPSTAITTPSRRCRAASSPGRSASRRASSFRRRRRNAQPSTCALERRGPSA